MNLNNEHLCALGTQGYVVVPNVVSDELIGAALTEIDGLVTANPPPPEHRGYHFYWCDNVGAPNPLLACLMDSPALSLVESAIAPKKIETPHQIQVSLNIPPWKHRPGGPHLDGLTPPEADGRPGTFTLLAGVFLSDQTAEKMGNLWVWPGTHLSNSSYLRKQGGDALLTLGQNPYPPTELPVPKQIVGRSGDLLLAHYLLGHNMGGNLASEVRKVVYFRLRTKDHRKNWRACVEDALLEFAPVRMALKKRY